jgi:hypothetical protein
MKFCFSKEVVTVVTLFLAGTAEEADLVGNYLKK